MTVVIVDYDTDSTATLQSLLASAEALGSLDALRRRTEGRADVDTVVFGPTVELAGALGFAQQARLADPALGVVLVRRRVDTVLLSEALRAGVREVLVERDVATVGEAVTRSQQVTRALRQQAGTGPEPEARADRGALLTVFSAKGGCGKTTLATNLAAALADGGRRSVCLVDLDLAFGDVAIALQLFPNHTIVDAVPLGEHMDDAALQTLLTQHSPGLATLVAPVEPGQADGIPAALVTTVLRRLKQAFHFVVVDTPPAFTDHVLAAFDESDLVALLATLDIPALKNLKLTLETLELLNYPRERWRVVLNRADSKVGLGLGEVEKTLRAPIAGQIPSSRAVPSSINRGVPLVLDDPGHAVSQAVKEFAEREIVPLAAASVPPQLRRDRRGLLRRKVRS